MTLTELANELGTTTHTLREFAPDDTATVDGTLTDEAVATIRAAWTPPADPSEDAVPGPRD